MPKAPSTLQSTAAPPYKSLLKEPRNHCRTPINHCHRGFVGWAMASEEQQAKAEAIRDFAAKGNLEEIDQMVKENLEDVIWWINEGNSRGNTALQLAMWGTSTAARRCWLPVPTRQAEQRERHAAPATDGASQPVVCGCVGRRSFAPNSRHPLRWCTRPDTRH